jgi:hypothetical protein
VLEDMPSLARKDAIARGPDVGTSSPWLSATDGGQNISRYERSERWVLKIPVCLMPNPDAHTQEYFLNPLVFG